jgi:hypothetical protein
LTQSGVGDCEEDCGAADYREGAGQPVMVILDGLHIAMQGNERWMPGSADELSDTRIAMFASLMTEQYGDLEVSVSTGRTTFLCKC